MPLTSVLLTWTLTLAGALAQQEALQAEPGLRWVRFNSDDFTRPRDTGQAEQVNVDTGTTFNDYSQIWLGLLQVPTDQPITIEAEADDGMRLFLDGTPVIDGWGQDVARQGCYRGEPGKRVPLRLEYYQRGGVGHLRLYWQWPGQERELIPASAFFHTPAQAESVQRLYAGQAALHEDRSVIYQPDRQIPGSAPQKDWPIPAQPGPHLLLDDYLIAESHNVERVVVQPRRDPSIPNPIVTGPGDRCFQPYMTVLRDPQTGRWRLWYGAWRDDRNMGRSHLATIESEDGIHFLRPHRICETPEIQFGSEVLDRGPAHTDPAARYIYSYWLGGGLRLLASGDGLQWRPLVDRVVLPHDHDINSVSWDPLRQVYVATVSTFTTGPAWTGQRRTTLMSFSEDLLHWETPWFVLTANNELDEGQTQFYAMAGYLTRGPLCIGMVKILRDDLRATGTQEGSFGRAHTSLAWSRDGRTWVRDRAKLFEPDDDPQAWDHAHAWIDEQVVVGDEVYLYYGGYKQGHKMNRFDERQIGLVKMRLDRYVARRASGPEPGTLKTVPIKLGRPVGTLQVNARAAGGRLRVQVSDAASGQALAGLSFADCQLIETDSLRQPVCWRGSLAEAAGRAVCLEFELTGADLFAFEFVP
jgi:hypothetical protein